MRFFGGVAVLTAAAGVSARFLPDSPPVTRTLPDQLQNRQATATVAPPAVISEDPWQCATEDITQYFDPPQPSANVLDAINSYGDGLVKPCVATAIGADVLSCTVTDPKSWCGFTTAAPSSILATYSTWVSEAVSFWTSKSSTMSVLATSCPVAWGNFAMVHTAWVSLAVAHAECYLSAHPQTKPSTGASTPTASTTPANPSTATAPGTGTPTATTTKTASTAALGRRGQVVEALASLIGTGFAVLANAA
jgi:hypothetical protein